MIILLLRAIQAKWDSRKQFFLFILHEATLFRRACPFVGPSVRSYVCNAFARVPVCPCANFSFQRRYEYKLRVLRKL